MTQFIPIEEISPLDTEAGIDTAFFTVKNEATESLYLAYSVKRDFLSVPLTYSVIEFIGSPVLEIHQMGIEEYLDGFEEEVSIPQPGFYQFEANDDGAEEEDELDILVLVDRDKVLEITFESKRILSNTYHSANAKVALMTALQQPALNS